MSRSIGSQRLDVNIDDAKVRPAICRPLAFRGGKGYIVHSAVNVTFL